MKSKQTYTIEDAKQAITTSHVLDQSFVFMFIGMKDQIMKRALFDKWADVFLPNYMREYIVGLIDGSPVGTDKKDVEVSREG